MAEHHVTHGLSRKGHKHPAYGVWECIKARCYKPENDNYKFYGARGVTMCDEWKDDAGAFVAWCLANGWMPGLQVDRFPDKDGPYCPSNCRIVTPKENCRNTRRNRLVAAFGETKCIVEWTEDDRCSVNQSTLCGRLRNGMAPEEAITKAPKQFSIGRAKVRTFSDDEIEAIRNRVQNGEQQSVIARELGVSTSRLNRMVKGRGVYASDSTLTT